MKNLEYQQRAVTELIDKTIRLLNAGGQRNKWCLRQRQVPEKP